MSKYVVGGHWTTVPDGWTILTEQQCDITKPLPWVDNSVEVAFSCHVIEHLSLPDAIGFFHEAKRVLIPGGTLRTICPFVDRLIQFREEELVSRNYAQVSLKPYYSKEEHALAQLGISLTDHGMPFLFDSLIKNHGHKFVWSTGLMTRVLEKVGFSMIHTLSPGQTMFGQDPSNNLERVIRGVDPEFARSLGVVNWDCESMVVEAIK